jgi:hypothetical protein
MPYLVHPTPTRCFPEPPCLPYPISNPDILAPNNFPYIAILAECQEWGWCVEEVDVSDVRYLEAAKHYPKWDCPTSLPMTTPIGFQAASVTVHKERTRLYEVWKKEKKYRGEEVYGCGKLEVLWETVKNKLRRKGDVGT